ncbi:MAG: TIGR01212 family radical SAM protein [Polyangia bacterium]|nr:TIGR01212 family radical SAM protein [Polyangia bacterium]
MTPPRFRRLSAWLRERYGTRVFKVSLRGGFTCPNRDGRLGRNGCAFCAGDALEPPGYTRGQDLSVQLSSGMDYVSRRYGVARFVAYFQDYSATYASASRLREVYGAALARPEVVALAVGTRPDCLDGEALAVLDELRRERDVWLELGLQIADDAVLEALGRGHGVRAFIEACEATRKIGLPVCAHVIIGLPGVTSAKERETASLLGDLGLWGVKLHAFHVVEGSPLARQHRRAPLGLLSMKEHVERVVAFLEELPAQMVVHRVTGEAPPRLTLAPTWTVNKLVVFDAVVAELERAGTWQGRLRGCPGPGGSSG